MKIRFKPHKRQFFTLFEESTANAIEIARLLVELLSSYPGNGEELIGRIKEREHEGDRITYEIAQLINNTFVTPFDRDDIRRLAQRLDDICDFIDEAAADVRLFDIKEVPDKAKQQAATLLRAVTALDEAVRNLEGFKHAEAALATVQELEDEGDRLNREAIAELFRSGDDPIRVMAWKEIHEQLEEALDACENASDVLEAIFVKNR
jgi:predicted phosphate transport protein (TIGR00153 family)